MKVYLKTGHGDEMKLFMKTLTAGQRKDFEKQDEERRKVNIQEHITVISDVAYLEDDLQEHRYDCYFPADNIPQLQAEQTTASSEHESQKMPVVFNIHGGGLITGSKEYNKCFCADIAEAGLAVYSIEYRKLPDTTLDVIVQECITAMNYILSHLPENVDGSRVFVTGDSGGGLLALYCTALLRSPSLCSHLRLAMAEQDIITVQHPECAPKGMVLISPLIYTSGKGVVRGFYELLLYKGKQVAPREFANPEEEKIMDALPESLFFSSKLDNLLEDSRAYTEALQKHGKKVDFRCFEGELLTHDFTLFHPEYEQSKQVVKMIIDFLKSDE